MKVKLKSMRIIIIILSVLLVGVSSFSVVNVLSQVKSEYMVEFVTNTNKQLDAVFVEKDGRISHLETPVREGYTFKGWYSDAELTRKFDKDYGVVTENMILYGKWEINSYYIIFETNGGTSVNSRYVNYGEEISTIDEISRKEGYDFTGWFLDAGMRDAFSGMTVKGHTVLYAGWVSSGFVIDFDTVGGSTVAAIYPEPDETIEELPEPEKYGYRFLGWYTEEDPETLYNGGILADRNYHLIAKWEKVKFTVTFKTNKKNLTVSPLRLPYLSEVYVSPAEYSGYAFTGWFTDESLSHRFVNGSLIEEDIVLYAGWEEITHEVSFITNGGNAVAPVTIIDNEKMTQIPTPVMTGHKFKGWFIDASLLTPFANDTRITKNYILYAKWEVNRYTITYVLNNGTPNITVTADFQATVTAPGNPERVGYSFTGWDKATPAVMPAENMTISATWKLNEYSVKFITGGGTPTPAEKFYKYGEYFQMDEPVSRKTGYTLQGWYSNPEDVNSKWDFTVSHKITAAVTLYALWNPNIYTIQYYIDGKLHNSQDLEYEEDISLLIPEKTGFMFTGWLEGDELFTLIKMPDRNIKLYASWTALTYEIAFANTELSPVYYECESLIGSLPTPDRLGFVFSGWYMDSGLTLAFNLQTMPAYNVMLYPRWEINSGTIGFETNGGTAVPAITGEIGSPVAAPDDPERPGYMFAGWYEDRGLTKPYEFTTVPAAGIVLYAKWAAKSYTISFVTGSGDSFADIVLETDEVLPELPIPFKEGFVFAGWYADAELTEPFSTTTMPAYDVCLHAKWGITIFKIVFEEEYGIPTIMAKYGEAITPPADPVKEGCAFAGWYTDREYTNEFLFTSMPEHHVYLFAKWTLNTYTVSFNTSGGTAVPGFSVVYNTEVYFEDITERLGYTFAGWYLNNKYTQAFVMGSPMPAGNITLYAKWVINKYKVTFHDFETKEIYYDYNAVISYVPAARVGHTFLGWFADADFTVPAPARMATEDMHLYAKWQVNNYTITLNSNGGTAFDAIVDGYDQTIIIPHPSREGHTFAGWYEDAACTLKFGLMKMPARNLTLYAKWTINEYKISFATNGGSFVPDIFYDFNAAIAAFPAIEKTGHTFLGWYEDGGFVIPFSYTIMPANDIRVYAKWQINTYTITFDSNGGSPVPAITGEFDMSLSEPAKPVREGYTLKGWYRDAGFQVGYNFTKMPAENITLYAKWTINEYKISFTSNGGSPVPDVLYYYNAAIDPFPIIEKTGHTFLGWYVDGGFTTPFAYTIMPANDLRVYAKWQINTYTITFESNGGSFVPAITGEFNMNLTEPVKPVKEGHTFKGWYRDAEFQEGYNFIKMPEENITVYAKWEINTFKIVFRTNIGIIVEDRIYDYNDYIDTLPVLSEYGSVFLGWFTEDDALFVVPDNHSYQIKHNISLHAKWEKGQYTITFNTGDGSAVAPLIRPFNTLIYEPEAPEREKYQFAGWYTDAGYSDVYVFERMPGENITVYAKWERVDPILVVFVKNNGEEDEEVSYPVEMIDEVLELIDIEKTGYTFKGWFNNPSFSVAPPIFIPDHDVTLYAKWEINTYTITFNTNGGSSVAKLTKNYDAPITAPTRPTKTGHTFKGWYGDAELTEQYVFDRMPAENLTLYAGWEVNEYTITFNSNGGGDVSAVTQAYGSAVSAPANPGKEGYHFTGWYLNNEQYVFSTMPAKNLTLTAEWNKIPILKYITNSNDFYLLDGEDVTLYIEVDDDDITQVTVTLDVAGDIYFVYLFPNASNPFVSGLNGILAHYYPAEQLWLITLGNDVIKNVFAGKELKLHAEIEDGWGHKILSPEKYFTFEVNTSPVIHDVTPSGIINVNRGEGFEYEVTIEDDDLFIMRLETSFFGPIIIYADSDDPYGGAQNRARLNSRRIYLSYTKDDVTGLASVTVSFGDDITYYASTLGNLEFTISAEDAMGNQVSIASNYEIVYN